MPSLYGAIIEIKLNGIKGTPTITDTAVDELVEQLQQFCNKYHYEIEELSLCKEKQ